MTVLAVNHSTHTNLNELSDKPINDSETSLLQNYDELKLETEYARVNFEEVLDKIMGDVTDPSKRLELKAALDDYQTTIALMTTLMDTLNQTGQKIVRRF